MKRHLFLTMVASVVVAAVTITFLTASPNDSKVDANLLSSDLEALTNGEGLWDYIDEWWDSEVYDCIPDGCSMTVGIPPFVATYDGTYENCEAGDSVAHCWECADCNAGPF
jgi:hypothetical protein